MRDAAMGARLPEHVILPVALSIPFNKHLTTVSILVVVVVVLVVKHILQPSPCRPDA